MAAIKYVDLTRLAQYDGLIKNYVNTADAKAFKSASFNEETRVLSLFKTEDGSGTAGFTVTIPETDVSGLLEKLTGATVGNVVTVGTDGVVVDGGVALADLATDAELKTVSDKVDAIQNAETGVLAQAKKYTDDEINALSAEGGAIKANTDAITKLNGDATTEGSVAKAVKDASDAINTKIGAVEEGKTVVEMIADAKTDATYDDTEIKKDIKANADAIGDLTGLTTTDKATLVGAVNEVKTAVDNNATAAKVTVSTETTTEGYLKSYTIKQGETQLAVIDIPKDLVVTSGEVVTDPEGMVAGTYVKLTIANQEAPIYINVKDLVDAYTAQQNATQIQLAVSATNEISATIVAGSVGTTELADGAVTTAKIADANVTAAKLADDAKALFDAAGSASASETNSKNYTDALANGQVKTNKEAIEALQTKVGDGMEAITEAEIAALFA